MTSVALGLLLLGQNFAMGYPPIPTAAALTPDDCIAIACKNGVVFTLDAGGIDDYFIGGFNPGWFSFSKSGRYLAIDESPPDDPHRLFVYDRDHNRIVGIVFHEAGTYDWHTFGVFLDNEVQLYCLVTTPWFDEGSNVYFKFADIQKNTIRNVVEPREIAVAEKLFASAYQDESKLVAERVENRRWMHVKRKSDGALLRRMAPSDELWYQEYTLINDRLLVTFSSRGTEFIDVREGKRLLYARHHDNRSATITFYTPDGAYAVLRPGWLVGGIEPEFPEDLALDWNESKDDVFSALAGVIRIAKEGWPQ